MKQNMRVIETEGGEGVGRTMEETGSMSQRIHLMRCPIIGEDISIMDATTTNTTGTIIITTEAMGTTKNGIRTELSLYIFNVDLTLISVSLTISKISE